MGLARTVTLQRFRLGSDSQSNIDNRDAWAGHAKKEVGNS
jgi:hypothetical protein